MKNLKIKIITLITAFIMALSFLVGCNESCEGCKLFTTNTDRDLNQVIATVKVNGDAPTEKITKREVIMLYMQYGESYMNNYGYSNNQLVELFVDSLVNNRIAIQKAAIYLNEKGLVEDEEITDVFNLDRYLDEEDFTEISYQATKSINDLIEANVEETDDECVNDHGKEEEKDTSTETVRTSPTGAGEEAEKTIEEKQEYIEKGINKDSCKHVRKAYNVAMKMLLDNGLVSKDFDYVRDSIEDTEYYTAGVKSFKEDLVLEKYQDALTEEIINAVTFEMLEDRYVEMYNAQVNDYVDPTTYADALSNITTESPVIYNPYAGYGYVYNLLLGINDTQTSELEVLKNKKTTENLSNADYKTGRTALLNKTLVKDLRSTWLNEGYDFDMTTKTFTNGYSFASEGNRLAFQGEVTWLNEDEKDEEDYTAKYRVDSVTEFSLSEFISVMDNYLYGEDKTADGDTDLNKYFKKVTVNADVTEFDEKAQDLLFAFSTDGGSLNNQNGYVVKPKVDVGGQETYVAEFAEASRDALSMGKGSYIMVATDYGYHVIFNAKTINVNTNYATLTEYLDSLDVEKTIGETTYDTWAEYYTAMLSNIETFEEDESEFFLYLLQKAYTDNMVSTAINNKFSEMYKEVRETKGAVKVYKDRYESLLVEEE